jgi:aspartyl-tRNA(Asn)/glutamyl-tRNA(Gln) amidotransferase subunit A
VELCELTIHEAQDLLSKKEITARELTQASIDQIEKMEPQIGAFLTLCLEHALEEADEVDRLLYKDGKLPDLAGIPSGIKDNICMSGLPTTCASRMLKDFIPPYDATVVKKLKGFNAVLMGKLNMDEFAMGSSTENSAFQITRNPWNLLKVPGGSSGGGAAAVAAKEIFYALGSDTGGSVRQPAAFCGIVGLKPTYGTVSRYGLIAYASSLDQIGTLTKDVTDCALVLNAIAGYDPLDSTSLNKLYPDYRQALVDDVKGVKIGVPKEMMEYKIQEDIEQSIKKAIGTFEELGAIIVDVSLPHIEYALVAYYIIACAEASSNLARYDGIKYGYRAEGYDGLTDLYEKTRSQGFGKEVKRRILLGNYALSTGHYDEYYLKALKVRTLISQDYAKAFEKCDVILTPTAPSTAFNIGEKLNNPMSMYLSDIYTVPVNIAGLPAISIPCGFDKEGLPIGMQLTANLFNENMLIQTAYTFEQNTVRRRC